MAPAEQGDQGQLNDVALPHDYALDVRHDLLRQGTQVGHRGYPFWCCLQFADDTILRLPLLIAAG